MLLAAAVGLAGVGAITDHQRLLDAAWATGAPFSTLALILVAGALAGRLGLFAYVGGAVASDRLPVQLAPVAVLGVTALISGLINLDVAAVVAPPIVIAVAGRQGLQAGRLLVATAITANATSFLLPTSNVTTLLVLDRSTWSLGGYVRTGWLSWTLATVTTLVVLSLWMSRSRTAATSRRQEASPRLHLLQSLLDLLPMFVIASAVRALLSGGISLHGDPPLQFVLGSLLAAGVNNLPAAAAVVPPGPALPWAVLWAMAIGPNLVVTGSVATLICRRCALESGVSFSGREFSSLGLALLPLQFAAASAGLWITSR